MGIILCNGMCKGRLANANLEALEKRVNRE
jgi:hypothetical protein